MEITIHKEKISHFTFHGEKRADQESRKYPLVTTLFIHESLLSPMSFHRKLVAVQYRECENRLYVCLAVDDIVLQVRMPWKV